MHTNINNTQILVGRYKAGDDRVVYSCRQGQSPDQVSLRPLHLCIHIYTHLCISYIYTYITQYKHTCMHAVRWTIPGFRERRYPAAGPRLLPHLQGPSTDSYDDGQGEDAFWERYVSVCVYVYVCTKTRT